MTTQIQSSTGAVLANGSDTSAAETDALAAGTYVVKVSPASAGVFGAYHLKTACGAGATAAAQGPLKTKGGCSSTGDSALPMGAALVGLALVSRRRGRV